MRYTDIIGSQADYLQHQSIKPKYYPCPQCGTKGKRKRVMTRRIAHVAALHRRSWIVAEVGVYKARCACCKYFQASIAGVPYRGRYSWEVRNTIANAVIRDRMPYQSVIRRMQEDYHLQVSVGYIHACFLWAHEQINMAAHWEFVLANFSGVLCIDEVHDSGRTILFATDPLGDFTVSFKLVETNDQDHMNTFLQALKERGLDVQVAITDGSPLYKDSLQRYWTDIEHQLGIFHVIKEVNKLILDGVRTVKNRLKRQGNKGRKKRRGRPSKKAQKQKQYRTGMSTPLSGIISISLSVKKKTSVSKISKTWRSCCRLPLNSSCFGSSTSSFTTSSQEVSPNNVPAIVACVWSTIGGIKPTPCWPKR